MGINILRKKTYEIIAVYSEHCVCDLIQNIATKSTHLITIVYMCIYLYSTSLIDGKIYLQI
jgi:hypothetical protein